MDISSILQGGYHHPLVRSWQGRQLTKLMLMYPIFITSEPDACTPIDGLPGQRIWGVNKLEELLGPLVEKGLKSVILSGIPVDGQKDNCGSLAGDPSGLIIPAILKLRKAFPSLYIACEVCLCTYTATSHCGLLQSDGTVDNARTVDRFAEIALNYAKAGAHCVAPSDMADGRIQAIKKRLIDGGFGNRCTLMSYSAKFASLLDAPFIPSIFGTRSCYKPSHAGRDVAREAILRNSTDGADIIAVEPALPRIDLIFEASKLAPNRPIACYQSGGEFAMVHAAVAAGAFNLKPMTIEGINCMVRAGATLIITYFTPELLDWLDGDAL